MNHDDDDAAGRVERAVRVERHSALARARLTTHSITNGMRACPELSPMVGNTPEAWEAASATASSPGVCVCERESVCVRACVCACACVRVRETESERAREGVCARHGALARARLEYIRVFKAGLRLNTLAWNDGIGLWCYFFGL